MNAASRGSASHLPRAGESPASPLASQRRDRIFRLPNGWYFNTREQVALGPFVSAVRAESAIGEFLDFLREAPDHVRKLFSRSSRGAG